MTMSAAGPWRWPGASLGLLLFAALAAVAAAADKPPSAAADLRIRGVFDSELPQTEWRSQLRFVVHPHFGDLTRRNFLRVPLGVRFGLTERWEADADFEGYFSHGLKADSFAEHAGMSGVRVGTKYRWGEWLLPHVAAASGISFAQPIGKPPEEITDGLRHVTPFLTFSHELRPETGITLFLNTGYDFAEPTHYRAIRRRNEFSDDSWSFTPGFVWNRGKVRYTLEAGLATNAGLKGEGAPQTVYLLRPGFAWQLPRKLTFNSQGNWIIGLGLRLAQGPDGTESSLSAKLRGDFDFKRLIGRGKK
jgi:hypothetical protein